MRFLAKYLRRVYKPIHNKRFQTKIQKHQSLEVKTVDYDELIPDQRMNCKTIEDQVKHIGLRILRVIEAIGKKNNFTFSLAYGTLLGAIRHDGFIPWDDDIDVFMTVEDLNQFIKASNQLPDNLLFIPMDVDFFKVMDRSSIVSKDGKRGVAVDIFILNKKKPDQFYFFNVHTLKNYYLKSTMYFPLKLHKFEAFNFLIPKEYDSLLQGIYGDYMQLPPPEKRISHHSNWENVKINSYGDYLVDENNIV